MFMFTSLINEQVFSDHAETNIQIFGAQLKKSSKWFRCGVWISSSSRNQLIAKLKHENVHLKSSNHFYTVKCECAWSGSHRVVDFHKRLRAARECCLVAATTIKVMQLCVRATFKPDQRASIVLIPSASLETALVFLKIPEISISHSNICVCLVELTISGADFEDQQSISGSALSFARRWGQRTGPLSGRTFGNFSCFAWWWWPCDHNNHRQYLSSEKIGLDDDCLKIDLLKLKQ